MLKVRYFSPDNFTKDGPLLAPHHRSLDHLGNGSAVGAAADDDDDDDDRKIIHRIDQAHANIYNIAPCSPRSNSNLSWASSSGSCSSECTTARSRLLLISR